MEDRLTKRFDAVDVKLDSIPKLETRIALVEHTNNTLTKGLWTVFVALAGTIFSYLMSLVRHP